MCGAFNAAFAKLLWPLVAFSILASSLMSEFCLVLFNFTEIKVA